MLDVSRNDIDNLVAFCGLRHLWELSANGNKVTSLNGILDLDGFITLSLGGNQLKV